MQNNFNIRTFIHFPKSFPIFVVYVTLVPVLDYVPVPWCQYKIMCQCIGASIKLYANALVPALDGRPEKSHERRKIIRCPDRALALC
jgi:hypothetical protein